MGNENYAATILVSLDLTKQQRAHAASYQPGDVIRYSRGSPAPGLEAGEYAVVQSTEGDTSHLRVTTGGGRTADYDPRRLKGVRVFARNPAFAHGERIQFRLRHRQLGIANGQFATISALDTTSGRPRLGSALSGNQR